MSFFGILQQHLESGFCLHGSKQRLELLEPQQAHCESGRPEGCLNAVYAERHDARIPIMMALFAGNGTSSYSGNGSMLTVAGTQTFSPGYVYVLPSDTFEDVNGEYVSFVPVAPVEILPVDPSVLWELLRMGNFDLKIPIPEPW